MNNINLYHGSGKIVSLPEFSKGTPYNDFGAGFYCTAHEDMAGQWACHRGSSGFINKYVIDIAFAITAGISIYEFNKALKLKSKPIQWLGYIPCILIALIHVIPIQYLIIIAAAIAVITVVNRVKNAIDPILTIAKQIDPDELEREIETTPKSVNAMTSVYLPRINRNTFPCKS